jgi:hypothetical protein
VARADVAALSDAADELVLMPVLAETAETASYWGDPDALDWALADHQVQDALLPVARAVAQSTAARWWPEPVARDTQHYVEWAGADSGPPFLSGASQELAAWRSATLEDERPAAGRCQTEPWTRGQASRIAGEHATRQARALTPFVRHRQLKRRQLSDSLPGSAPPGQRPGAAPSCSSRSPGPLMTTSPSRSGPGTPTSLSGISAGAALSPAAICADDQRQLCAVNGAPSTPTNKLYPAY